MGAPDELGTWREKIFGCGKINVTFKYQSSTHIENIHVYYSVSGLELP